MLATTFSSLYYNFDIDCKGGNLSLLMPGRGNLPKSQLGGVIFGCKNATMRECLSKQLFGLPAQHFSYVKNIDPGLPLFLFNYTDRTLHGIFEAASKGRMLINPYGWTTDGSERTQYPAQVQIYVRLQCQPLSEDKFKEILADNYYTHNHFWFELDHAQTSRLISLLSSGSIVSGNSVSQNTPNWMTLSRPLTSNETWREDETSKMLELETDYSTHASTSAYWTENDSSLVDHSQPLDTNEVENEVHEDEMNSVFLKLKELTVNHESQDLSLANNVNDSPDMNSIEKGYTEALGGLDKKEESSDPPIECQYNIAQFVQEVKELTSFKKIQIDRNSYLEQKLIEAEREIQHLKDRCTLLESACSIPNRLEYVEKAVIKSTADLDPKDSLFLIGGFDGNSWLATMDLYCTSQSLTKPLKPMNSVRSYASVVRLNSEIYVLGGGNGYVWYDTVHMFASSLVPFKYFYILVISRMTRVSKSDVEENHLDNFFENHTKIFNRFALGAVELNGSIYATGGFDGTDYLRSAERFDPREHSWTKISDMNVKRGCHCSVVLNEKLYALGGFDGEKMVQSIEVFDPRLGVWTMGEPMVHPRGYCAAVVVNESIYMIGGVRIGEDIVDKVENYKEGQGWQETYRSAAVNRCFLSAIACSHD
ncbi:kelch-like protein 18 [Vigna unguiculata]|uniref:Kelch-like protein 18 n=1 Tax=Vigna unguiculata TaxID=3917 RepID=A0A4D6NGL6_VIGUN|nr:kelch-like protein 18 [Vigna unguiculata]